MHNSNFHKYAKENNPEKTLLLFQLTCIKGLCNVFVITLHLLSVMSTSVSFSHFKSLDTICNGSHHSHAKACYSFI